MVVVYLLVDGFLPKHSFFISSVCVYMCVYTCIFVYVEVRGQPHELYLRSDPPCFFETESLTSA